MGHALTVLFYTWGPLLIASSLLGNLLGTIVHTLFLCRTRMKFTKSLMTSLFSFRCAAQPAENLYALCIRAHFCWAQLSMLLPKLPPLPSALFNSLQWDPGCSFDAMYIDGKENRDCVKQKEQTDQVDPFSIRVHL